MGGGSPAVASPRHAVLPPSRAVAESASGCGRGGHAVVDPLNEAAKETRLAAEARAAHDEATARVHDDKASRHAADAAARSAEHSARLSVAGEYAWNRGLHATSISTMVGPWCSLCSQLLVDARLCTSAKSAAVVLLRQGAQCVMLARRNSKSGSDVLPVFLPDAWLALQPWPSLVVKQVGYYGVQVYLLECYPASTTVPDHRYVRLECFSTSYSLRGALGICESNKSQAGDYCAA